MHVRQQIRARFKATLTGLSITNDRVYTSRVYPLVPNLQPTLVITTPEETVETSLGVMAGFKEWKKLTVKVKCVVKAVENFENILDDICAEVSTALFDDYELGSLGQVDELKSTRFSFDGNGDQPLGVGVMSFSVLYRVDEIDPTVVV